MNNDGSQHQSNALTTIYKTKNCLASWAGLLESEFDWLSQIPYGETWVVFSTDQLLIKSTTIAFQIDLSVQFILVPCLQRWTA